MAEWRELRAASLHASMDLASHSSASGIGQQRAVTIDSRNGGEVRVRMRQLAFVGLVAVSLFNTGCEKKLRADGAVAASGATADSALALAYEHHVSISVAKNKVNQRLQDVRAACSEARFGPCELMQVQHRQDEWPSGNIVLRVAPDAVEPLVKLAAAAGNVGSHSTLAHDLSRKVADTAQQTQRLQARRVELAAFRERKDLAVADMLALANEIARVEVELAAIGQQAAESERRISTNLLTIEWSSGGTDSGWSTVGEAITEVGDTALEGLAESITYLAWLIPALVLAFPIALLWRALWRRATRPK